MNIFRKYPRYSWDKIKHKLACRLIPGYRKKSLQRTKIIVEDLKRSRELIINYIRSNLISLESVYSDMVKRSDMFGSESLRFYEKKIIFHRQTLLALESGKSATDIDVVKLLNTIFLTSDPLTLENYHETNRHRKNNP